MCSTPWSLNFSPSSVPPDGNEETDFFKNSKYASSAKCACSKVCFTPRSQLQVISVFCHSHSFSGPKHL